jgi:hypothetical protein
MDYGGDVESDYVLLDRSKIQNYVQSYAAVSFSCL